MNNRLMLNQLITMLRDSSKMQQVSDELIKQRIADLDRARAVRPYWLPVSVTLDGIAGKTKTAYSDPLDYPLIVLGGITNNADVRIRVATVGDAAPWSIDPIPGLAVAGSNSDINAMPGPLYFPVPFILAPRNRIAVDVVNVLGTNNNTVWIVFVALRVSSIIEQAERDAAAINWLQQNRQRNVWLTLPVRWASQNRTNLGDTLENLTTTEQDVPLLLWGATTQMVNCRVQITDPTGYVWSPTKVPVWSLAGGTFAYKTPYQWFPKPVYLPARTTITASFINGLAGQTETTDGEIVFLCTTV